MAEKLQSMLKKQEGIKLQWYQDTDFAYSDAGVDKAKVWKSGYKGKTKTYEIVAYPLSLIREGNDGWEYRIGDMNGSYEFDSLTETSVGSDHASTAEQAMRWAENTLNDMVKDGELK